MVLSSPPYRKVFAVFNAVFGALIISFLIETLILRVVYSSLLFFGLYFLQNLIFDVTVAEKEGKCADGKAFQVNKVRSAMFFLGFLASIAVVIVPVPVTLSIGPFSVIFLGLPWWVFIRILLGLFLLSIFPGYMLYDAFLSKFGFGVVEKIGLTFALSFSVNTLLGLILLKFDGLTLVNILISIWLFVAVVTIARIVASKRKTVVVNSQSSQSFDRTEYLLLCIVFTIMLFSSYAIILSSDVGDPALGGDINRNIAASVSLIRGETPLYLSGYTLLLVFTFMAHYLTGLHVFASYVCLEFFVLLVPTSFYLLLKTLYSRDRKPSVIGAVLIPITSGFASLGLFDFMATYNMGGQSTFLALSNLKSKTALGAFAYQFYVMPLSYSLLFLSLAFAYRYCCRGRRLSDLLLCGLFAVLPLFTHSIFEFSCFLVTSVVFLLFSPTKNSVKAFLKICLSVLLFFIPFEVTTGTYSYTFINYSFHFTSVFGYSSLIDLLKFPLIALLALVLLLALFRKRISCLSSVAYRKVLSFPDSRLSKVMLWGIATVFFILTLYFWRLNWPTLNVYAVEWLPWYITILTYGFTPYLIIVALPYVVKKGAPRSLLFMFSWLLAVFLLASLSLLNSSFFPTPVWGRRWLYFAFYPLMGLTAIGLSAIHFTVPSKKDVLLKFRAVKIKFSLNELRYLPPILLIFAISFSFLSYAYTVELFYSGTYAKSISDPEAKAYNWILRNTPENAVFLTVTGSSTTQMESLACRKSFGYSDAAISWPLQVLFNSRLPDALLYSLKELDVSYIFITPRDTSFLAKNLQDTYLNSLLNVLPVVYEKDNVTLYAVPKYPMYEDSNYVLVSPIIDFQNISHVQASLALYDNFSTSLTNWMTLSGDWAIANGELHTSGKGAINNSCRIVSNQSFSNFVCEYKGKSMMLSDPQYIWGIFRYVDKNNFYSFYVGNTTYFVYECLNGSTSAIAAGKLGMPVNLTQWNSVKIEATYSTIKLYVNDNLIKTMQGTGREGKIGLQAWSGFHTCYDDVNVTSLTLPVDSKSALLGYQVASNMLVAAGVNFTIVPDVNLIRLQAGNVYIFPFNWHVTENILPNLQEYVSQGAHVVFFDPLFGSFDELDAAQSSLLSSTLQVKVGAALTCSDVCFEDNCINLIAKYTVHKLVYADGAGLRILANYTTNNQTETPYIIQKQIGLGTVTFVHVTDFLSPAMASTVLRQDLLKNSLHEIMKSLPKPVETRTELSSPFPQGLYKFTRCNDIPALLSLKDLYDCIYVYGSPIVLNGSCVAESNYVLMMMEQMKVNDLEISNATDRYSLRNDPLSYISLKGLVNLSLETDYIMLSSSPYYGGAMTTFSLPRPTTIHVNLINAELQLKTNDADPKYLSFTTGNCTIVIPNSESSVLKIALKQPVIKINGSLNLTAWQGIFWYGDKAIINFVINPNQDTIRGNLSLQLLCSFGGVQIKVEDVQDIQNVERHISLGN
jgi:hypothetical protein